MSAETMGLAQNGVMFWTHGIDYKAMRLFALQYGKRYVYDEYFQLMEDNKLIPYTNSFMLTTPVYNAVEMYKKHGIKAILFADRRDGSDYKYEGYPFLCDPAVSKAFIKSIDKELKEHGDVIWAVSAGDEIYEHDEKTGVELFATKKNEYDFIRQADQEVKSKYGGGRYGMPQDLHDNNPFRWIAYRKWLNDRYTAIYKEFYRHAKAIKPDVLVASIDPIAFHHPFDFSRASEYCDILRHQLYPRRDSHFAKFGFLTKLLVDLSGVEVWPCAHVEEYAASFTPEEVLEMIGQIFRNGGNGLDYYLDDTVGRRAKVKYMQMEYFGAPDRWQIEMALASEMRKMKKLKFPKADCAILYSCDSYASQTGIPTDEAEIAYMLLGPNAGSWFTFIDDYQIERRRVTLSDYKVIYVPFAPYERRDVVQQLADYIKAGGIMVCGDPFAFSYDDQGNKLDAARKELLGPKAPLIGDPVIEAKPQKKNYPNMTVRTLGKGRIYYFASNPFVRGSLSNKDCIKYFKQLQVKLGVKTDQKIWRFQFPTSLIKKPPLPSEECLTGNYIYWQGCTPLSLKNLEIAGTYSYSLAPDSINDQGGIRDIPFTRGDLTDRQGAPLAGNVDLGKSPLSDWVVQYKTKDSFNITFDLKNEYSVKKIKLFYSHNGVRPGIRVDGSVDGRTWTPMGSIASVSESKADVRDVDIPLSGSPVRYLRINFDKRDEGNILTLSEMEIWGNSSAVQN
jgi:hypothetical protein